MTGGQWVHSLNGYWDTISFSWNGDWECVVARGLLLNVRQWVLCWKTGDGSLCSYVGSSKYCILCRYLLTAMVHCAIEHTCAHSALCHYLYLDVINWPVDWAVSCICILVCLTVACHQQPVHEQINTSVGCGCYAVNYFWMVSIIHNIYCVQREKLWALRCDVISVQ